MELKTYQKNVIADLARFLALLTETGSASKAYNALWNEKNVNVGINGLPNYHYNLSGYVPDVCFKIPTGGGKTFVAASSVRRSMMRCRQLPPKRSCGLSRPTPF